MTTPRPDQRHAAHHSGPGGSRSGSGDLAASLGYPGVPPAALNLQSAQKIQQNVGTPLFFTFPAAGRIWSVTLTYVITSNASFTGTVRTFAKVVTVIGGVTLATADAGVGGPSQHEAMPCVVPVPGLAVQQGDSIQLSVNGGVLVAQLDQQASAIVLYSIP